MKGAIIDKVGGSPRITDDLERPQPSDSQILVKSLYMAINPVDSFIANTGMIVQDWPIVIGVDASGIIVEAGKEAQSRYKLQTGMYVCGCTRVGMKGYSSGQEYFLMDAQVVMPKPANISLLQAATLGVAIETAACAVFQGLHIDPESTIHTTEKKEWAIVLGGASSVGWYGIQLLRAAGYEVLASCSQASAEAIQKLEVATFDYKQTLEDQLSTIIKVTDGNVTRILDAVAMEDPVIAKELFKNELLQSKQKLFATTNDWSQIGDFYGGKTYCVEIGPIGRPESSGLNNLLAEYIPTLVRLVEAGRIKVGDYELKGHGFENIIEAYRYKVSGISGLKKVVVKVQDE